MTARDADLAMLERGLAGAAVWGLELDTKYRVLALTVEPTVEHHPHGNADDRRLQVLLYPSAMLQARLLRASGEGAAVIEQFKIDQLVDVVARLDGATISPPLFDRGAPGWGEEVSLRGESTAPDGRAHDLRMDLVGGGRRLELHATFDDVQVLDPAGTEVPVSLFRR